jgi:hypothetical protein
MVARTSTPAVALTDRFQSPFPTTVMRSSRTMLRAFETLQPEEDTRRWNLLSMNGKAAECASPGSDSFPVDGAVLPVAAKRWSR